MNKITFSIIALSLIFAVNSCSSFGGKSGKKNKIEFDTLKVDSTYHLFGDTTKPAITVNVELLISNIKDKDIRFRIQKRMIYDALDLNESDPQTAISHYTNYMINDYKMFETEYKAESFIDEGIGGSFVNEQDVSQDVTFNQDGILVICSSRYSYTGGAHGLTTLQYTNFNIENGNPIMLADIFVDDYERLLTPIILEKLVQSNNVTEPKQLEDQGFFEISEIKASENFYLEEKGITFFFNPYEIACYAMGPIRAFIPYDEISFIISDKSIVRKFL